MSQVEGRRTLVRGHALGVRCVVCGACLRVTVAARIVGDQADENGPLVARVVTGLEAVGLGCPNGHQLTPEQPGVACEHDWQQIPSHANEEVQLCKRCKIVRTIPKVKRRVPRSGR